MLLLKQSMLLMQLPMLQTFLQKPLMPQLSQLKKLAMLLMPQLLLLKHLQLRLQL